MRKSVQLKYKLEDQLFDAEPNHDLLDFTSGRG